MASNLSPIAKAVYVAREVVCSGPGRVIVRTAADACDRKPGEWRIGHAFRRVRNAALTGGVSAAICLAGKDKTEMAMDLVCDGDVSRLLPKDRPGQATESYPEPYPYGAQPRRRPAESVAAGETNADLIAALRAPSMGHSASDAKRAARFIEANGLSRRPFDQRFALALLFLSAGPQAALARAALQAGAGVGALHGALHGLFR